MSSTTFFSNGLMLLVLTMATPSVSSASSRRPFWRVRRLARSMLSGGGAIGANG